MEILRAENVGARAVFNLPNHVDFSDPPPLFEKFNKQIIDILLRIIFFHKFLDSCDADIYIFLKIIIGKKGL